MALPILTTIADVQEIAKYLRSKPTGATIPQARSAIKKQSLDPRKISAYHLWGIINKDGNRLRLTELGWRLARNPDTEVDVFRTVISHIEPYRSALEWMYHQEQNAPTNVDVAAHWHEHHSDAVGTDNEQTLKDSAVCFFHLCQGAGLGKIIVGRQGQLTRLQVDREALTSFIEQTPEGTQENADQNSDGSQEPPAKNLPAVDDQPLTRLGVFISHGKNKKIVEQVQTILNIAEMDAVIAEKEESTAIPVPEKVFNAMRRCQAGVIVVSVDEGRKDGDGRYVLNENVLIEIGAAFVLYDKRVVLLWDKRLSVPSNLQGLYRCEFEGDELSWTAGERLIKGIQDFKKQLGSRVK